MAFLTISLFLGLLLATEGAALGREKRSYMYKSCPFEWSAHGLRCFKFFKSELSWTEAEKACLKYGGNLASVHNYQESIFLQNLIKQATESMPAVWLGGIDTVSEGTWLWSDGSYMHFQDWLANEPNNYGKSEHCLEMYFGATNGWNDFRCNAERPFVCALN